MKFLIDNNLSFKLVESLGKVSIEAVHVRDVLTVYASDQEIWDFAKR